MTDFARLVLASDTTGLRDARTELNQLTRTGAQTEGRVNRSMSAVGASFRSVAFQAAAMVGAVAGIGAAVRGSQEIVGITNGLRAMGMSASETEQALDDIAGVAERTRAPLRETAELYRRVSVAGRDMGASQADVLRFTENVGLALAASGTSAQEASGALLQLSQAMAGGVVRAEEFNSILEGAFPIAQAAADGIDAAGGSVGRLRILVTEGKISSEEFFRAVISQTDALEAAFGRTVPTIAQAMTVLGASISLVAFGFDDALGVSEMLASGIMLLAQGVTTAADAVGSAKGAVDDFLSSFVPFGGEVDSLRVLLTGTAAVVTGMYLPAIASAAGATATWVASLVTLRGALMATGIGALVVGAGLLIDFLLRLRSATGSWGEALSALGDLAAGVWEGIKTSAKGIAPALSAVWEDVKSSFFSFLELMTEAWSRFLGGLSMDLASIEVMGAKPFQAVSDRLAETSRQAVAELSEFNAKSVSAAGAAEKLRNEASALATEGFDKAKEAAKRLAEIVGSTGDETSDAADEARNLVDALDGIGGGAAGRAATGVDEVSKAAREAASAQEKFRDSMSGLFDGLITGGKSFSDVLQDIARRFESRFWDNLFSGDLFGGGDSGGGGFLSGLFGGDGFLGLFDSGGTIGAGQWGIAGERRPELVTGPSIVRGPAKVIGGAETARMMQGGANQHVTVSVHGGDLTLTDDGTIAAQIQVTAAQTTQAGIQRFDREVLPRRMDRTRIG